jgi:hypothetical protein
MIISINGQAQDLTPSDGYFSISRKWKNGDIVEIKMPMNLRSESMPDDKNKIAFFYGPVLLAGALEKDEATRLVKANQAPALIPVDVPFDNWLKPTGTPLEFITTIAHPDEINLKPLFKLKTGPYTVYWQLMSEEEFHKRSVRNEQRVENLKKLELFTFDKVTVGDEESERKHLLTGNSTPGKGNSGILNDEVWRSAEPEGFSYNMETPADEPISLLCKFMGRIQNETWDCRIKIDTTTIMHLKREMDDSYTVIPYEYCFPVPFESTRGKKAIKVEFEVKNSNKMPRLMETRILRRQDYKMYPAMTL